MIAASTLEEASQVLRVACLTALPHIKLDSADIYRDIQHEIVTPDNAMNVARNMNT